MITLLAMRANEIGQLFNSIAKRYDFLNSLLSLGIDRYWRWKTATIVSKQNTTSGLDVATGTAEQLIALQKQLPNCKAIVGIDASCDMIDIGQQKVNKLGLNSKITLQVGDACCLPFKDNEFDFVTCSFGIRNIDPFLIGLQEMFRVLKKNGQLVILEFSLPTNVFLRQLYLIYFRNILPLIGRVFSKHETAYRYLNRSVEAFQKGDDFVSSLREVGFSHVYFKPLTFGIVSIYVGVKQ